jgi:hypothetical protein
MDLIPLLLQRTFKPLAPDGRAGCDEMAVNSDMPFHQGESIGGQFGRRDGWRAWR